MSAGRQRSANDFVVAAAAAGVNNEAWLSGAKMDRGTSEDVGDGVATGDDDELEVCGTACEMNGEEDEPGLSERGDGANGECADAEGWFTGGTVL